MALSKITSDHKKLTIQLSVVALLMAAGMTLYETLKQTISPNITIWQSHMVTIAFSTIVATVVSFFILRRHIELNSKLSAEAIESEHLRKELEITIEQLKDTISKVKTLSGFLPICSSCKKIRDDKGYWNQIESYISEHSEVDFSHSICPACEKKLYPEYYEENHA